MLFDSCFRKFHFPLVFLLVLFSSVVDAVNPLPDTGQSASYTGTFGEDSDYLINPPSYTKLGENGMALDNTATIAEGWMMTKDNVTDLVWEIKTDDGSVHDKDKTYTWYDPSSATNGGDPGTAGDGTDTKDMIDALNNGSFGGYTDWRLPTREELRSILSYDACDPAIDTDYFPNTGSYYWSATTCAFDNGRAWLVSTDNGYGHYELKQRGTIQVRAVRGEQADSQFVDNGDGTITDITTGLMWQQLDDGIWHDWEEALSYCENLELAGYDDWRLPNFKELASIVDLSRTDPAIDPLFSNTKSVNYWSSTTRVDSTANAWCPSFDQGIENPISKTSSTSKFVRAVRGGQGTDSNNDSDGDGLSDAIEAGLCTDSNDGDTDDDGIPDGMEDVDCDGSVDPDETDPCDSDTDGDGIQDGTEIGVTLEDIGTDTNTTLFVPDSDPETTTDPLNDDTDNDGLLDGAEDANQNGAIDTGETDPNTSDAEKETNDDDSDDNTDNANDNNDTGGDGGGGGCFISNLL